MPTVRLLCILLTAALPAQAPLAGRIAEALQKARPALLHHLANSDRGELALCCLAAAHDGVPASEPVFRDAIDRLARAQLDDTYGLALRLMVMAEVPDFPRRAALAATDTEELLRRQTSGGFSYHQHDGWWDLSNTQYAALGLRAAVALGVEVPLQRWRLLYQAVERNQHEDGAFTYRTGQGRTSAYESMTVAGIAVLAVTAQFLALDEVAEREHRQRIERAWQWLAGRRQALGDRRTQRCYYFHYGLERAAILTDREQVGGVDWYQTGALMLCEEQKSSGGWWGNDEFRPDAPRSNRGHAVDTSFAILFLRRKFQKVQPPVTGLARARSQTLAEDASDVEVKAAAVHDAEAGDAQLPALLSLLRSEVVARRKAAVLAIFAITGEHFGLHPYRDPQRNEAAIAAAEQWWLRRRTERAAAK
jgi:hypothetical protein